MVKGLDNFHTFARIEDRGIDPRIVLEARQGSLSVMLGNWTCDQARSVAKMLTDAADEAESEFRA